MWALVMFDLPVRTKLQRRNATRYRNLLLDLGFTQVQLSVYCKLLINASGLRAILPSLRQIPSEGEVRILRLTDEQWAATWRFRGASEIPNQRQPEQLVLIANDISDE